MNIGNYDKAEVLAALYNNATVQGMGFIKTKSGKMTKDEAADILGRSQTKYFGYLKCRVMKISLATDDLDTRLYNRDNGKGAAERAIEALAKKKKHTKYND